MEQHDDPRWTVLSDLDGTLVDTNYLHTLAWWRALRDGGEWAPMNAIHRLIGMGGDELVAELLGDDADPDPFSAGRADHYKRLIAEAVPFPGAVRTIREMHRQDVWVVLATSSPEDEVDRIIDLLGIADLLRAVTTADDVKRGKPDAEVFETAMRMADADPERTIVIGDSVWDIEAATAAGLPCIALESGGSSRAELTAAGASVVYASIEVVEHRLLDQPLRDWRLSTR